MQLWQMALRARGTGCRKDAWACAQHCLNLAVQACKAGRARQRRAATPRFRGIELGRERGLNGTSLLTVFGCSNTTNDAQ
jgi:hypothetical protein